LENGYCNWIIPNKILACCSPSSDKFKRTKANTYGRPFAERYVSVFKQLKIKKVIRLNKPRYSTHSFELNGISHKTLYFPDGSVPNKNILKSFLKEVE